jgi:hypothetical protein
MATKKAAAKTPAERQAAYRERGRQIAFVLRDPAAQDALDHGVKLYGSIVAAITHALVAEFGRKRR